MWYNIDFNRLALLLLPTFLRKPKLFGFVNALVKPVADLHYMWLWGVRDINIKKLSYSGQRCYLRKALNDRADPVLRRIYIANVPPLDENFLYQPSENLDFYLDTMYLDLDYTEQGEQVDFIVYIPNWDVMTYNLYINQIIAILEFYTLAGKTYKIISI